MRTAWDSVCCITMVIIQIGLPNQTLCQGGEITLTWCWEINITGVTEAKRERETPRIISYVHVQEFHLSMYRKWVCILSSRTFLSLVQRSSPAFLRCLCSRYYRKCYDNKVWEAAQWGGSHRDPHTLWLGELLTGKVHHTYFLDIFGNSTTENISIIICSVTEDW